MVDASIDQGSKAAAEPWDARAMAAIDREWSMHRTGAAED
jgi:hypothetical protein